MITTPVSDKSEPPPSKGDFLVFNILQFPLRPPKRKEVRKLLKIYSIFFITKLQRLISDFLTPLPLTHANKNNCVLNIFVLSLKYSYQGNINGGSMEVWQTWIVIAVILLILEIFTPGFILACFGIGCLGGGLMDYLGFGFGFQIAAFSVVSIILFYTIRPIVKKHLYKGGENVKTNVDALTGLVGIVDEKIDPVENTGRVVVGGDNWKAVSVGDVVIEKDQKVKVIKVEGIKVHVTPYITK
jgi:membrane protein implicated in regulation of membrane protease activity